MKLGDVKQVAVIGAGNMGAQITQLIAQVIKLPVTMMDTNDDLVQKALQRQRDNLQKFFVDKKKITPADMQETIGRIKGTTSIREAVKNADFIIEAVFENLALKKDIFKQLDEAAPPRAILASNSSMLSITEMAAVTKRADKVGGMHFFNPPLVMRLVEVIRAPLTSEETSTTIYEMAKKMGKEPIYCRDTYGFLANRAVRGRDEAIEMLWAHIAPPEDIDKAIKLGYNWPMGPLELADLTGGWLIDVTGEEDRIRELGFDKGHVHPLVRTMVRAGYTGGPGKKGVYDFWRDVLSKW